jgi:hypothetical protein
MDKKQLILWLAGIVGRGIAWILTAKLGMAATEAGVTGVGIAEALGALALFGISIYSSVKGRKALLAAEPK